MKAKILFYICLFLRTIITVNAQVKIGDNPNTINDNSLLELESSTKGFLAPRVAINNLNLLSPLSATTPAGMLVYSISGTVTDGFYNWNGNNWVKLSNTNDLTNPVSKTANSTLLKTDAFVLASNDITLTLPAITSADNGLAITIKNVGNYTDLINIVGDVGATIDNISNAYLTRWQSQTYIAYEGNWIVKEKTPRACNILDVSSRGSWTTLKEVIEFLNSHMCMPVVIRLVESQMEIENTITIDLPYPLTITGASFGTTTIVAASGLENKPMFRCISECYFKMLMFDATSLSGYGTLAGEDCIRLAGDGTYHEIKDCTFDGFYNTILDSTNAELWLFECDISNAHNNGVLLHSAVAGAKLRVAETDFISCIKGINLEKGSNAIIQITSGAYLNANATDVGINYVPATFTNFTTMSITNNSWNNIGFYIVGFDFTRSDGRDANAFLISNAGMEDENPHCKINVLNNATTTSVATANTWVKANWINTNTNSCKFTIGNNKITYQTTNSQDLIMIVTGNVICINTNKIFSMAIVKNGNPATRYGETTARITSANFPYQWATNVYIPDAKENDYFEVWITSNTNSDDYILQDVNWFSNTQ